VLKYNLFSLEGTKLRSGFTDGNSGLLDLSDLKNGIFLLELVHGKTRNIQKIRIQK